MVHVPDTDPVFETGLYAHPEADLTDKSIFVTGATGCFGSRLVETICGQFQPKRLIVFSRDESKQFEMARRLNPADYPFLRYVLGDVRDLDRLVETMKDVDVVVHAAAMKHVTLSEQNPMECLRTNAQGTQNVIHAAERCGVTAVSVVSTDKAVQPVNMYGASKLAAEKIATSRPFGTEVTGGPRTHVVRFGNFVGSRGSVIPIFNALIRDGSASLPVTDQRMTRFWITVDEAVNFALSSLSFAKGGEIFVPKLRSMAVVDLARFMAPNLKIVFTGLRDGERLHEQLIASDVASNVLDYQHRYVILRANRTAERNLYIKAGAVKVEENFSLCSNSHPISVDDASNVKAVTQREHLRLLAD